MKSVRKIDDLGRLVIPSDLRKSLNIAENDEVDVFPEGDRIILQKHRTSCVVCDSADDIHTYKEKPLCGHCYGKLNA